jgi:hypothetical protein
VSWPDPRATALDRARTVARTYRDALTRTAPDAAHVIDQAAASRGEGWVCGATSGDKSCTVHEAALLLAVTDRRVRQLIADGAIRSSGRARDGHVLLLADVLAYRSARRRAG